MKLLLDLIGRLFGRPEPSGFREITCADGTVTIGPSAFFTRHLTLRAAFADGPSVPLPEPVYLTPDEAREVASALIAAALEVEREAGDS